MIVTERKIRIVEPVVHRRGRAEETPVQEKRLGLAPRVTQAQWEAADIWDASMILDYALSLDSTDDAVDLSRVPTGRIIPRVSAHYRRAIDTFDPEAVVTQKDLERMGRDVYAVFAKLPGARTLADLYQRLEGGPPSFS